MGSVNNNKWLGFSMSAEEVQDHHQNSSSSVLPAGNNHHQQQQQLGGGFRSDEQMSLQESASSCFDVMTSADSPMAMIPSLNLPPPFGILEAFNTSNTHSQGGWNNMKEDDVGGMNKYSSCNVNNNNNNNEMVERPKLENFLGAGGHMTFADELQEHKNKLMCNYNHLANNGGYDHHNTTSCYNTTNMYQQSSISSDHHQQQQQQQQANNDINNNNSNSGIGLSMIKNWLRNNPSSSSDNNNNNNNNNKVVGADMAVAPPPTAQTLSLSMSTGSQSSSTLPLLNATTESCTSDAKDAAQTTGSAAIESSSLPRKSIDTFGQRTSIYRGVTRHRWTGRYEAHLWDNSCRREGQTRKGRQVYLGGYDKEDKAARSYDLAALKYWGTTTITNFPIGNYEKEIEEMKHMTRQEFIASLRRKSSGFSRGASIYRGVTRHHQHGRWQARIGRVAGNKDLYLGTFSTQEEAAEAYDIAAIKFRGLNAVTNFEINRYDVKSILESSTLPIGGAAKRLKEAENAENMALDLHRANEGNLNLMNGYGIGGNGNTHNWPTIAFQQSQPLNLYPYAHQRLWCKQEQDNTDVMGHGFGEINHQLQLGSTQNFMPTSFMHNMTSVDYSTVEQSSVSNAAVYGNNNASGDHHGNGGGSFMVPMMGTVVVEDGNNQNQTNGYEGMFGSSNDAYQQARNLYYQSHQQQPSSPSSSSGLAKASLYDHEGSNNCNNWIPTAVPTIAARSNYNVPVCNGASTFTVWNDT